MAAHRLRMGSKATTEEEEVVLLKDIRHKTSMGNNSRVIIRHSR
jgi:hypothetical protein